MACCAMPGGCDDPTCNLCTVVAHLVIRQCIHDTAQGYPCRLVEGHPGEHLAVTRAGKTERADLKESARVPDLSADRAAATSLAFKKRKREGAFRQQRA